MVIGLAAAFANDTWTQVSPGYLVMLAGYWVGVLVGFGIATVFGRLSAPRVRSI
ncbi:MAG: hypothetical protein AVDCRST_MAG71-1089 [uncultured Lysobacter sp.]|uniref:Uncharacterized protein n=1 Tax=uncultured Lysobacter sp. TaxID=271060 RepID=A0A6J4KYN1_9GAMM|nr:MAG: hypothetical protein AVDCRST_MAG71-1089 [uncultured Lysobacter sp.]